MKSVQPLVDTPSASGLRIDVNATRLLRILRIGVAMCFIGHGAFGVVTKEAWVPYFAVAGISEVWAWRLMPLVGTMDIAIGFLALIWPCRAIFAWAAIWATWTALLRPLAGQGWSEFFERAGNYGIALGALAIVGLSAPWFSRIPEEWPAISDEVNKRLAWTLRIATATLLAGHAGLAVFLQKGSLEDQYAILTAENTTALMLSVGYFEFVLAAAVLVTSLPFVFVFVAIWKVVTEALILSTDVPAPMFEVIERGGSYLVPLALALLYWSVRKQPDRSKIGWQLPFFGAGPDGPRGARRIRSYGNG
ncbi:MAG: hypothetical protein GEU90_20535 [Gemmatimonas sp.]|nr:hypothetical protein [Gemmatimonas sp.]